jgi:sugar/nucleoside kinase (ribokinase family)
MSTAGPRILCLGDALVDLICERPLASPTDADAFVPHSGGAIANVAVMTAAAGGRVALAGAAGDDAWGRWLRKHLLAAGVGIGHFTLVEGASTSLALTTLDRRGEPAFAIYGNRFSVSTPTIADALSGSAEAAAEASEALFIGSNTLVGRAERAITLAVRAHALELGRPVIFDPNLRLHRWSSRSEAATAALACVPGALLVRCNGDEARMMSAEDDLERAALALLAAGARNVVITDGIAGAMLRGAVQADVPAVEADVLSTIGAGDALMAVLLARLQGAGYDERAIAAALGDAMAAAAQACQRWGACD